jgi:hypothetical protein
MYTEVPRVQERTAQYKDAPSANMKRKLGSSNAASEWSQSPSRVMTTNASTKPLVIADRSSILRGDPRAAVAASKLHRRDDSASSTNF